MSDANYLKKLSLMPNWPAFMRREVAALYVGPVSLEQFDRLVENNDLPQPVRFGSTPMWKKQDLDLVGAAQLANSDGLASGNSQDWMSDLGNLNENAYT